jgi:hypothetical protein
MSDRMFPSAASQTHVNKGMVASYQLAYFTKNSNTKTAQTTQPILSHTTVEHNVSLPSLTHSSSHKHVFWPIPATGQKTPPAGKGTTLRSPCPHPAAYNVWPLLPASLILLSPHALTAPITTSPPASVPRSSAAYDHMRYHVRSKTSTTDRYPSRDRHASSHNKPKPSSQRPLPIAYVADSVANALALVSVFPLSDLPPQCCRVRPTIRLHMIRQIFIFRNKCIACPVLPQAPTAIKINSPRPLPLSHATVVPMYRTNLNIVAPPLYHVAMPRALINPIIKPEIADRRVHGVYRQHMLP